MNFDLTEEQKMVRNMAKDFVDKEVVPHASEWERNFEIPDSVIEKMAGLGMLGGPIPREYGGAGMDYVSYSLMVEELGRGCSSLRTTVSVQTSLAETTLLAFGDEEQKNRFLVPLAQGGKLGAWALTEPNAGSDAAALETTASLKGDEWILNGTKMWISNGDIADIVVIFASTDRTRKHAGISTFVVEKGTDGFKSGSVEIGTKLGLRSSHTAELILEDCRIPKENMIGGDGKGWEVAQYVLNHGRLSVAAGAVGIARACLEESIKYSKQRIAFGRPISKFQLTKEKIAEMATEIDAGRLLYLRAAQMRDRGVDNTLEVSMAKLFAANMVMKAADYAVQIHGGYGYSGEYPVERYFRDARICGIYEGTNEIQKLIIARILLERSEA
jgi:alkylation response protein AidB-like acyl-CoA dehydrogenase